LHPYDMSVYPGAQRVTAHPSLLNFSPAKGEN
jgi:hypothetical protein